jgi:hypothetical protein
MKITRKQLRRIIKEYHHDGEKPSPRQPGQVPTLRAFVQRHAVSHGGQSINDNIAAALADPDFQLLGISEQELGDAIEDYYDEMMGF